MNIHLTSGTGYYVRNIINKGVSLTNKIEQAYCFNDMTVEQFTELKSVVEKDLKCELETEFRSVKKAEVLEDAI